MKIRKVITLFLLPVFFAGCDPGLHGKSYINNESTFELQVSYHTEFKDSSLIIQPNSRTEIFHFGRLGEGRDYDCCSCEFSPITLKPTDTSKHLLKNIGDSANWYMTNTNHKRFDSHEITCEFVVKQSDVQ